MANISQDARINLIIQQQHDAALKSLDEINAKVAQIAGNMDAATEKSKAHDKAVSDLKKSIDDMTEAQKKGNMTMKEYDQYTKDIKAAEGELKKLTGQTEKAGQETKKTTSLFKELGRVIIAAFAVERLITYTKQVVSTAIEIDRIRLALENVSNTQTEYAKNIDFLNRLSMEYGQNIIRLTQTFTKFTAATSNSRLEQDELRRIYESVIQAGSALKLSNQSIELSMLAVEQMFSKGTVSMEELRRQLGDQLPGAFDLAAKAMGMTTPELNKQVRLGMVLADDLWPRMADLLQEMYGEKAQSNLRTIPGQWNRVSTAVINYIDNINQSRGITEWMAQALSWVADNFDKVVRVIGSAIVALGLYKTAINASNIAFAAHYAILEAGRIIHGTAILALDKLTHGTKAFTNAQIIARNAAKAFWAATLPTLIIAAATAAIFKIVEMYRESKREAKEAAQAIKELYQRIEDGTAKTTEERDEFIRLTSEIKKNKLSREESNKEMMRLQKMYPSIVTGAADLEEAERRLNAAGIELNSTNAKQERLWTVLAAKFPEHAKELKSLIGDEEAYNRKVQEVIGTFNRRIATIALEIEAEVERAKIIEIMTKVREKQAEAEELYQKRIAKAGTNTIMQQAAAVEVQATVVQEIVKLHGQANKHYNSLFKIQEKMNDIYVAEAKTKEIIADTDNRTEKQRAAAAKAEENRKNNLIKLEKDGQDARRKTEELDNKISNARERAAMQERSSRATTLEEMQKLELEYSDGSIEMQKKLVKQRIENYQKDLDKFGEIDTTKNTKEVLSYLKTKENLQKSQEELAELEEKDYEEKAKRLKKYFEDIAKDIKKYAEDRAKSDEKIKEMLDDINYYERISNAETLEEIKQIEKEKTDAKLKQLELRKSAIELEIKLVKQQLELETDPKILASLERKLAQLESMFAETQAKLTEIQLKESEDRATENTKNLEQQTKDTKTETDKQIKEWEKFANKYKNDIMKGLQEASRRIFEGIKKNLKQQLSEANTETEKALIQNQIMWADWGQKGINIIGKFGKSIVDVAIKDGIKLADTGKNLSDIAKKGDLAGLAVAGIGWAVEGIINIFTAASRRRAALEAELKRMQEEQEKAAKEWLEKNEKVLDDLYNKMEATYGGIVDFEPDFTRWKAGIEDSTDTLESLIDSIIRMGNEFGVSNDFLLNFLNDINVLGDGDWLNDIRKNISESLKEADFGITGLFDNFFSPEAAKNNADIIGQYMAESTVENEILQAESIKRIYELALDREKGLHDEQIGNINKKYQYEQMLLTHGFNETMSQINITQAEAITAFIGNQKVSGEIWSEYQEQYQELLTIFPLAFKEITEGMSDAERKAIEDSNTAFFQALGKIQDRLIAELEFVANSEDEKRKVYSETETIRNQADQDRWIAQQQLSADTIELEKQKNLELEEEMQRYEDRRVELGQAADAALQASFERLTAAVDAGYSHMISRAQEMYRMGVITSQQLQDMINRWNTLARVSGGGINVSARQQFATGSEYITPLQGGTVPSLGYKSGVDTVPAMLTKGERVLTVGQNRLLGNMPNWDIVKAVKEYQSIKDTPTLVIRDSVVDSVRSSQEYLLNTHLVKELGDAIGDLPLNEFYWDERGYGKRVKRRNSVVQYNKTRHRS